MLTPNHVFFEASFLHPGLKELDFSFQPCFAEVSQSRWDKESWTENIHSEFFFNLNTEHVKVRCEL